MVRNRSLSLIWSLRPRQRCPSTRNAPRRFHESVQVPYALVYVFSNEQWMVESGDLLHADSAANACRNTGRVSTLAI